MIKSEAHRRKLLKKYGKRAGIAFRFINVKSIKTAKQRSAD